MPRIVDHGRRRQELVEVAWRVVAERGLGGATLRQIAEEAGYAHGALKPYFPTRTALVEATYAHVLARTEARIDAATAGLRGLAALRRLCAEILPVDPELLEEARLVLSFWDQAARHEAEALTAAATLEGWRSRVARMLGQAQEDGELRPGAGTGAVVGLILTWLFGSQATAVVDPDRHDRAALVGQLDALEGLLRP